MALITDALGDLVKPPLTAIRTIDQVRAEGAGSGAGEEEDEIPPEIARQAVHEVLDRHYRETFDQPVPALDGKTLREAARTPAGRRKVLEWLKLIENRSASQAGSPMAEYDFRWMWEELGLGGLLLTCRPLPALSVTPGEDGVSGQKRVLLLLEDDS